MGLPQGLFVESANAKAAGNFGFHFVPLYFLVSEQHEQVINHVRRFGDHVLAARLAFFVGCFDHFARFLLDFAANLGNAAVQQGRRVRLRRGIAFAILNHGHQLGDDGVRGSSGCGRWCGGGHGFLVTYDWFLRKGH